MIKFFEKIKQCISSHRGDSPSKDYPQNKQNKSSEDETNKKRLISGKCTKPDESDIKLVVQYAHEKLDSKHSKDLKFDALDFNLLIAGELEIANQYPTNLRREMPELK